VNIDNTQKHLNYLKWCVYTYYKNRLGAKPFQVFEVVNWEYWKHFQQKNE